MAQYPACRFLCQRFAAAVAVGYGMVYKVDTAGNLTVLYDFTGGTNGGYPMVALAEDTGGKLYGTTQGLGDNNLSVVFRLAPDGTETTYVPSGSVASGWLNAPVALDAKGNLYGMDPYGGTPDCGWDDQDLGCGTLFKMTPKRKFRLIHTFTGTDGMNPQSGLVQDTKGNFYGAAFFGGIKSCKSTGNGHEEPGCGTIFKVGSAFTVAGSIKPVFVEPEQAFPRGTHNRSQKHRSQQRPSPRIRFPHRPCLLHA